MAYRKRAGQDERIAERRAKVLELRKQGLSSRKIALALAPMGIKAAYNTVSEDIRAVMGDLARETNESALECRAMELQRLDALQAALWDRAIGAAGEVDLNAADRVLRIIRQRSELLGLLPDRGVRAAAAAVVNIAADPPQPVIEPPTWDEQIEIIQALVDIGVIKLPKGALEEGEKRGGNLR